MRALKHLQENRKGVDLFLRKLVIEHGVDPASAPGAHLPPHQQPYVNGWGVNERATSARPQTPPVPPARVNLEGHVAPKQDGHGASPSIPEIRNSQIPPEMHNQRQFGKQNVKVYGCKAALCVEEDETKAGYKTVRIEAALAKQGANRKYDWSSKIAVQVTKAELPMVAAVFLGMVPQVEYKNHGPQNNKGFSFDDQGSKLFARVFSPEGVKALPISPEDAFEVSNLLLTQMAKNHPGLSAVDLIVSLRPMVQRKLSS